MQCQLCSRALATVCDDPGPARRPGKRGKDFPKFHMQRYFDTTTYQVYVLELTRYSVHRSYLV